VKSANLVKPDLRHCTPDMVGPSRVAAFVSGGRDDELQADVVGFVTQFLNKLGKV